MKGISLIRRMVKNMKCTNCKEIIPEDSEFCQFCGNKIEVTVASSNENDTEASASKPVVVPTSVIAPVSDDGQNIDMEGSSQLQSEYIKEKRIKTKFCSRCGSAIDNKTKICTGCGKKYFKIRINKFSVAIIIMSVFIAALTAFNVYQFSNTQNLQSEIVKLEKQVSGKESSLEYLRKVNADLRKENSKNNDKIRE